MFEAYLLRYTGPSLRLLAKVLGFRGLFYVLAAGLWFSRSRFRVIRDNFWVSQSVSCPGFGFQGFAVQDFAVQVFVFQGFKVLRFRVSGFRGLEFKVSWSVSCHVFGCRVLRFQSQVTHGSVLGFHGPVLVLVQFW